MMFCVLGNWWAVSNFGEITGTIAIEMDKGAYIHALDNGLFTLGLLCFRKWFLKQPGDLFR